MLLETDNMCGDVSESPANIIRLPGKFNFGYL